MCSWQSTPTTVTADIDWGIEQEGDSQWIEICLGKLAGSRIGRSDFGGMVRRFSMRLKVTGNSATLSVIPEEWDAAGSFVEIHATQETRDSLSSAKFRHAPLPDRPRGLGEEPKN
jgi:hypothetical protein